MSDWQNKQVLAEDVGGKIVKCIVEGYSYVLIVYTDGTYSLYVADTDYDDDPLIEQVDCCQMKIHDRNFLEILNLMLSGGIISEQEHRKNWNDHYENREQSAKDAERREYERLKAKFETQGELP